MMIPNKQKAEAAVKRDDGKVLDVHSMFCTLQGEGPFAGGRCVFVRLAGCNIQCPGCDTEYTEGRQLVEARDVAEQVEEIFRNRNVADGKLVVITGGEPLRQNLGELTHRLSSNYSHVQIESNGILPPSPELEMMIRQGLVTLVVSPKTWKIHPLTAELATCYKYVMQDGHIDKNDGLPTISLSYPMPGYRQGPARPPEGWAGQIYLSPMDEKNADANAANTFACSESAQNHGHRMGIQLHKLLNLE